MLNKIKGFLVVHFSKDYIYIFPLILIISIFILFPAIGNVLNSFYKDTTFLEKEFINFDNYRYLFQNSSFLDSLKFTLLFTLISVPFEIIFGLFLAILLNENIKGRNYLRVAVLIPWVIPVSVSARIWELIYNYNFGILNSILQNLKYDKVNWFGTYLKAFSILIITDVWKTVPFVAIILLCGLGQISDEMYEQAKIDGTNYLDRFLYVTIPMLKPIILVVLIFRMADALRVFDIAFVLTNGGPGGSTTSLSMHSYNYFLSGDFGLGSSVSVVLFIISFAVSILYVKKTNLKENFK